MKAAETALNTKLVAELTNVGGAEFAQIGALAYRQTLAATKLVRNNQTGSIGNGQMWNFLKEISTNGDMQTMDVGDNVHAGPPVTTLNAHRSSCLSHGCGSVVERLAGVL